MCPSAKWVVASCSSPRPCKGTKFSLPASQWPGNQPSLIPSVPPVIHDALSRDKGFRKGLFSSLGSCSPEAQQRAGELVKKGRQQRCISCLSLLSYSSCPLGLGRIQEDRGILAGSAGTLRPSMTQGEALSGVWKSVNIHARRGGEGSRPGGLLQTGVKT